MYKILIITRTTYNGVSLHSQVVEFNDQQAADKAYNKLEHASGLPRSSIIELVKLY